MTPSDRQQIEYLLQLKQTPELLQLIADAFPFLISYVDKDRTYRFHNKEYEKRFGAKYQDIHGKHIADVLGNEAYEFVKPYVDKVLAGEQVRYEALIPFKSGEQFMDVQYIPDIDEKKQVAGFITIVHYISERKKPEGLQDAFEIRMNEILSSLIELNCTVEEVRIRLDDVRSSLQQPEQRNEKINDLIRRWTADLKASESMVQKVKTAVETWLEKNRVA